MKKAKQHNVLVSTMEGELNCMVNEWTSVKDFMHYIGGQTKVKELCFFGLQYIDVDGFCSWMKFDKTILQHPAANKSPLRLKFLFKFFPEEIRHEISEESTLRLLYLQVKDIVVNEKISDVTLDNSIKLASLSYQAKFGPYNESVVLESETFLPKSFQGKLKELQSNLELLWRENDNMTTIQAMYKYVTFVQTNSRLFGKSAFTVFKTSKGEGKQLLSLDSQGINIYDQDNNNKAAYILKNDSPQFHIPWKQILNLKYRKRKLTIIPKSVSEKNKIKLQKVIVYTEHQSKAKHIHGICMGNLEMDSRRERGALLVTRHLDLFHQVATKGNEETDFPSDISNINAKVGKKEQDQLVNNNCTVEEDIIPQKDLGVLEEAQMEIFEEEAETETAKPAKRGNTNKQPGVWPSIKHRMMEMFCFYT